VEAGPSQERTPALSFPVAPSLKIIGHLSDVALAYGDHAFLKLVTAWARLVRL
jgi:hypothetical protein